MSMKRLIWFTLPALLAGMTFSADTSETPWLHATPQSESDLLRIQDSLLQSLPEARKAIVHIDLGNGAGSGVIVSKDGMVLTAGHVCIEPGKKLHVVLDDGRRYEAEALGVSDFADSGLIQITDEKMENLPTAPMAPSDKATVGDWVYSVGHPGGLDKARGSVVRLGRIISKRSARMRTDCRIIPGDSGGALFNMEGEVIGIHSRITKHNEENYHCPIEAYHADMNALRASQKLTRQGGWLGAAVKRETSGLVVRLVQDDTSAAKAGLQYGDQILEVNHESCLDEDDWKLRIGVHEIGEKIHIKVLRDDAELDFVIELGKRPR